MGSALAFERADASRRRRPRWPAASLGLGIVACGAFGAEERRPAPDVDPAVDAGARAGEAASDGSGSGDAGRRRDGGVRYEVVVVPGGLTWTSAAAAARARGGYLASITSRGENEAIWALVQATPDASYKRADGNWFGPWIGAHQPSGTAEPLAGWSWLHGEPWGFTAWYVAGQTEPNDDWATGEDHAHFYSFGQAGPTWADGPDDDPPRIRSYVVEYD